jgi:hypothetical protein
MQSVTLSFAVDHVALGFAFTMTRANVIETQEQAGEFKE